MYNKEFDNLDKTTNVVESLKKIAYVFEVIVILTFVITGIVLAVEGAVAYGLVLLFVGLIGGLFTLFLTYCSFVFLTAFVEMMYDVKYIRLGDKSIAVKVDEDSSKIKNDNESATVFLLLHVKRNAYFEKIEKNENGAIAKLTKNVLSANAFKSEEDAKKFAEEKRLKLGEDWKIVVKRLMVSND